MMNKKNAQENCFTFNINKKQIQVKQDDKLKQIQIPSFCDIGSITSSIKCNKNNQYEAKKIALCT